MHSLWLQCVLTPPHQHRLLLDGLDCRVVLRLRCTQNASGDLVQELVSGQPAKFGEQALGPLGCLTPRSATQQQLQKTIKHVLAEVVLGIPRNWLLGPVENTWSPLTGHLQIHTSFQDLPAKKAERVEEPHGGSSTTRHVQVISGSTNWISSIPKG